jgi:hypothetical protein
MLAIGRTSQVSDECWRSAPAHLSGACTPLLSTMLGGSDRYMLFSLTSIDFPVLMDCQATLDMQGNRTASISGSICSVAFQMLEVDTRGMSRYGFRV